MTVGMDPSLSSKTLLAGSGRTGGGSLLGDSIYPPGATNANWFNLFNALSWQITLGSPIVLYAKSLNASATILGVIASLMPLLVILQLPAAKYLPRFGYRRFIVAGWGSRTVTIFAIAGIPLLTGVPAGLKLTMLVVCLFFFSLLRGMASGAWMPWMTELIPQELRARFLARDQLFSQSGCLGAMIVAALLLRGDPGPWQFSLVFLYSAIMQTISLGFVKRVPDVTAPEKLKRSGHRVPWGAMLTYPPFFRLMVYNLIYYAMFGGLAVFTVAFLKGRAGYSESSILWLWGLSLVGALLSIPVVGRILDRRGSRPILVGCGVLFGSILVGWWLIASGLISATTISLVAVLHLLYGAGNANWSVANNRLMMSTMPLLGRNHFFALFTVITSVGWGLSPIAWGLVLDAIGRFETSQGAVEWNRYSIYFAMAFVVALAATACAARLVEGQEQVSAASRDSVTTGGGASLSPTGPAAMR